MRLIRSRNCHRLRALGIVLAVLFTGRGSAATLITPAGAGTASVPIMDKPTKSSAAKRIYYLERNHRLRSKGRHDPQWYEVALPDGRKGFAEARLVKQITAKELEFEVRFFNVKGGDVTLIKVGPTEVIIDGGGDPVALKEHLDPHIHWPLNLLILTHTEPDHWNGLSELLKPDPAGKKKINEIWRPLIDENCSTAGFKELTASLGPLGARIVPVSSSVPSRTGTVREYSPNSAPEIEVTVLFVGTHVEEENCNRQADNRSLVFLVTIGKYRFLFTTDGWGRDPGDDTSISGTKYVERALLNTHKKLLGTIDLVTVPNHGLSTTNTRKFVEGLGPRTTCAVILAGANTGVPDENVAGWYKRQKIHLYRTNHATEAGNKHVVCTNDMRGGLQCEYQAAPSLPRGGTTGATKPGPK